MKSVSIIIPAYNEEKYIGKTLDSLKEAVPSGIEIIVVNNNSVDETVSIVQQFPNIRLISETKKGVAFARATGAANATGEILLFLDADVIVRKGWFEKMQNYFQNENVVCVSGPTLYYDLPAWQRMLVNLYWIVACYIFLPFVGYMGIFANLAVRRDAFEKIGGINTSIEFYGDDTDITRRLAQIGKVIFSYSVLINASGRRLTKEGVIKTGFRYALNFFSEVLFKKPVTKGYTEIR